MSRISCCTVLLALAAGAAVVAASNGYGPKPVVPILKDDRTQNSDGEYSFQYQTGDGVTREESGSQEYGQVSQGGWKYSSMYGEPVQITFVANHDGYQPQGEVLPVPPPLPYTRTGH
ncbi:endocuticle structural glycoprotein SgAbd-8-like [Panulirus ornatus]|uniref:endocuticle structural glycoprotein SgAbd-8-like n=1 Tax=Panulirus ornatus TaxID=150431 RepID=UPI003A84B93D